MEGGALHRNVSDAHHTGKIPTHSRYLQSGSTQRSAVLPDLKPLFP